MSEHNGPDPQGLTDAYARREALLEAFEAAWRRGARPAIEDYLPDGTRDPEVLLDFFQADLEFRLKAGEPARAEDYLTRFPQSAGDPDLALPLIVREYELRQRREPQLTREEYTARFPQFRDALADRLCRVKGAVTRVTAWADPLREPGTSVREPSDRDGTADSLAPAERPPAPTAFPVIPGYEILGELGRGGMGVVYQARQVRLNRVVALKMILAGEHARPEDLVRFLTEAEAIARLQHPHIVQIFEVGSHAGLPYFAMEYLEGGSLSRKLQGLPLPAPEAVRLVETLARAMQAAHAQNIVHRDLKTANILLDRDGRPKVADFGLAKRMEADGSLTPTDAIMGSPSYMAPEQAVRARDVGPAADVYALGAILYELLTARPPFKAATRMETVFQVLHEDPVSPRRLLPKIPRDLETICLKCLQKEPARRYATAKALAEDLKRFLNGEPIRARPVSWWEKGVKWARRRPGVAASSAGVVVIILLALGAVVWQWRDARRAWEEADAHAAAEGKAKERAEAAKQLAEHQQGEAVKAREIAERGQREALEQRGNARDALAFLAGLFHGSDPTGLEGLGFRSGQSDRAKISVLELLDNGTRNVNAERVKNPMVRATLLDQLGNLYRSLGLLDKAGPLLEAALDLRQKHCGPEHEDTATSLYHVAWLYHDLGKYADAERVYRQALAARQKRFGKDSLPCAQVMFNLAWALAHQFDQPSAARYEEAEQLLRQVLKIRQDQLGDRHRDVGLTLAALATLRFPKSEAEGARLALRAVAVLESAENKDLLGSGYLKYYWAHDARRKGRYQEAEVLYRECITEATALFGDRHPLVAMLLGDFAGLQRSLGDLAGAEDTIRRALDIGRRSMRNHPAMILALMELADHVRAREAIEEAEDLYREAFDIAQQLGRPDLGQAPLSRLVDLLEDRHLREETGAVLTAPP